ncbi:Fe2+-enterobactin ABC transporter substrate-binding protein [Ketobacter sp. MCCC 1A13808]|uniref:Fe2+-enterobactin ABC transporter substrate-binding protein n=1 Tax=Ketobacter sp. MCCC 1A13808 TaxID=2602738 RepID=UPI000F2D98AA|nr:Fe2+-enterobactin ABC transporter substrate-binding protein [Ketobacter sp. MCCC 1A13808]MVF11556.1 Fe2+-enterobactin ABC transporter substrate-binding protein [Ketobacter sp. MCCC 1A13808]RLP53244.1 MAG: Fe2+-enterobactin ABC transporter substrate-binding protein [Ketobacter sp.]
MKFTANPFVRLIGCLLLITTLSACDNTTEQAYTPDSDANKATINSTGPQGDHHDTGWPRTIGSADEKITLAAQPKRIVSTSVSVTGVLLAINAPVIASGASQPNTTVTNKDGFFTQWSDIANQRNVQPLYHGEADAEIIASVAPDLIIVTATGGDSALKIVPQLKQIAPTLVVNYDDKSWQQVAEILGAATGHEKNARHAIQQFSDQVQQVKQSITLPPQPVTAITYYEDGSGANVWTGQSAQGKLLTQLGFELAIIPETVKGELSQGIRKDIVQVSGEKFADALQGQSLMLFSADQRSVEQIKTNPFLNHLPPVQQNQLYALGLDTFRLDYYSASHLLTRLEKQFSQLQ